MGTKAALNRFIKCLSSLMDIILRCSLTDTIDISEHNDTLEEHVNFMLQICNSDFNISRNNPNFSPMLIEYYNEILDFINITLEFHVLKYKPFLKTFSCCVAAFSPPIQPPPWI